MQMQCVKSNFLCKIEKLRALIKESDAAGISIETQNNFSWLTGGRGFIGLASEMSCASVLVTMDGVYLIVNNIEQPRICTEEIGELTDVIDVKSFPWNKSADKARIIDGLLNGGKYIRDVQMGSAFSDLRRQLSEIEIERYGILGKSCAEIVENICRNIKQGVTEFEIAGEVSRELWKLGIEPITIMVAFDERLNKYRHPIPTDNELKKYAMVVICARKWGLVVSLSRLVSIGEISEEVRAKHAAVVEIDTCFIANTRPGIKVKDIFIQAVYAYGKTGYGEEWKLHHQGGATGYNAREYIATQESQETVLVNQAFAWNPSIAGTKSEDTFIVTADGHHILTHTGNYVYLEGEYEGKKILRPDILVV